MICGMHNKLVTKALLTVSSGLLCVTVHADGGRLRAVVEGAPLSPRRGDLHCCGQRQPHRHPQRDGHASRRNASRSKLPSAGDALDVDGTTNGATASVFKGEIVSVEPVVRCVWRFDSHHPRLQQGAPPDARATQPHLRERVRRGDRGRDRAESRTRVRANRTRGRCRVPTHLSAQPDRPRVSARARCPHRLRGIRGRPDALLPTADRDSPPIALGCARTRTASHALLKLFHPRLASQNSVSKVTVRGWDAKKHEEIVATATRRPIPLSAAGREVTDPPGSLVDLGFVQRLDTAAASYGAAMGTMTALTAEDLSGEADADGNASLRVRASACFSRVSATHSTANTRSLASRTASGSRFA